MEENQVLNAYGVLLALCLSKKTEMDAGHVIDLLNEAGKD